MKAAQSSTGLPCTIHTVLSAVFYAGPSLSVPISTEKRQSGSKIKALPSIPGNGRKMRYRNLLAEFWIKCFTERGNLELVSYRDWIRHGSKAFKDAHHHTSPQRSGEPHCPNCTHCPHFFAWSRAPQTPTFLSTLLNHIYPQIINGFDHKLEYVRNNPSFGEGNLFLFGTFKNKETLLWF